MRLRLDAWAADPSSCFQFKVHKLEGARIQAIGFPGAFASAAKIASRCGFEAADDPVVAERIDKLDRWHAARRNGLNAEDAAVKAVTPSESKRKDWMKTIKDQFDAGRVDAVIAGLEPHRRFEAVATFIRTCKTNRDRMRCDLYRKLGLPVGSGVVESACKQIVGSRFKRAGCHWSKARANVLLAVKCFFKDNRWPDFLEWRACSAAAA